MEICLLFCSKPISILNLAPFFYLFCLSAPKIWVSYFFLSLDLHNYYTIFEYHSLSSGGYGQVHTLLLFMQIFHINIIFLSKILKGILVRQIKEFHNLKSFLFILKHIYIFINCSKKKKPFAIETILISLDTSTMYLFLHSRPTNKK